jgi:hypothetical protein
MGRDQGGRMRRRIRRNGIDGRGVWDVSLYCMVGEVWVRGRERGRGVSVS